MTNTRENLERSYQLFTNRQQPLDFFNDLAGYLDYVFNVPLLKGVFTKQLEKRNALYEQKWKLEEQAITEIREAKQKIEKILKRRKIDPTTLQRFRTSPILASSDSGILQEWDDYEKGRIQTGDGGSFRCNRRSDDYNDLVGDMAANLYSRGHKEDVKEFLVSDEEYKTYYRRINGPGIISGTSNPNGNFVFSRALPERWEVENLIQTERYAKPWGDFEKLYQFWIAHKNISRGVDAEGTLEEVARALKEIKETDDGKYVIRPDSYDILSMQIDFRNLLGERSRWHQYRISNWKPNRLVVEQIKAAAETVHNILLRIAEETDEPERKGKEKHSTDQRLITHNGQGNYLYDGKLIEMGRETMYYKVFDTLFLRSDQDGFLSYADIEAELIKRGVSESESDEARNKRINNAILNRQQGLFRFAKVNGKSLKNKTKDGRPLIELRRGKGLQLNNTLLV